MLKKQTIIIAMILCAGTVLRLWNINQSFWWDEIWSTLPYAGSDRLSDTIRLGGFFNNHILYSLLCRFSFASLGENEIAARLPALLMGTFSIPVLFHFGKTFAGSQQGLLGACLLAVSASHIDHSMEARGYSGLALLSLLSSYCFLKALRTNAKNTWTYYVLWNVLGVYMHLCMTAVIACQFVCTFFSSLGKKPEPLSGTIKNAYICLALVLGMTLLIYSPIAYHFLSSPEKISSYLQQLRHLSGSPELPALPFLLDYFKTILPGVNSVFGSILISTLIVIGFLFLKKQDKIVFTYLLTVICLPLLTVYIIRPAYIIERYFIFMLPLLLLVIGCGITYIPKLLYLPEKYALIAILTLLTGLTSLQLSQTVKTITEDRQNYREAADYVDKYIKTSRNSCVIAIGFGSKHLQYYLDAPLVIPETFESFSQLLQTHNTIWCITSGWLPSIHPAHEDAAVYQEPPEHEKIYTYINSHFPRIKFFPTRFPTEIFRGSK